MWNIAHFVFPSILIKVLPRALEIHSLTKRFDWRFEHRNTEQASSGKEKYSYLIKVTWPTDPFQWCGSPILQIKPHPSWVELLAPDWSHYRWMCLELIYACSQRYPDIWMEGKTPYIETHIRLITCMWINTATRRTTSSQTIFMFGELFFWSTLTHSYIPSYDLTLIPFSDCHILK